MTERQREREGEDESTADAMPWSILHPFNGDARATRFVVCFSQHFDRFLHFKWQRSCRMGYGFITFTMPVKPSNTGLHTVSSQMANEEVLATGKPKKWRRKSRRIKGIKCLVNVCLASIDRGTEWKRISITVDLRQNKYVSMNLVGSLFSHQSIYARRRTKMDPNNTRMRIHFRRRADGDMFYNTTTFGCQTIIAANTIICRKSEDWRA